MEVLGQSDFDLGSESDLKRTLSLNGGLTQTNEIPEKISDEKELGCSVLLHSMNHSAEEQIFIDTNGLRASENQKIQQLNGDEVVNHSSKDETVKIQLINEYTDEVKNTQSEISMCVTESFVSADNLSKQLPADLGDFSCKNLQEISNEEVEEKVVSSPVFYMKDDIFSSKNEIVDTKEELKKEIQFFEPKNLEVKQSQEADVPDCKNKEFVGSIFNSEGANIMECNRGELLLSDREYEEVLKIIGGNSSVWRFEVVEDVANDAKVSCHISSKNRFQRSSGSTSSITKVVPLSKTDEEVVGSPSKLSDNKFNIPTKKLKNDNKIAMPDTIHEREKDFQNKLENVGNVAVPFVSPPSSCVSLQEDPLVKASPSSAKNTFSPSLPPALTALNTQTSSPATSVVLEPTSSVCLKNSRNNSLDNNFDFMPDWARRFHHVVNELCKQEKCQPFVIQVTPADPHYHDLACRVYPAIPLSLETVLEKLEKNMYNLSAEAFSDVYTVFLCAFRYYEPGSQYWMTAQEVSRLFEDLIKVEKISDYVEFRENFIDLEGGDVKLPSHSNHQQFLPNLYGRYEDDKNALRPVHATIYGEAGIDDMLQNMISKNRQKKFSYVGTKDKKVGNTAAVNTTSRHSSVHGESKKKRKYNIKGANFRETTMEKRGRSTNPNGLQHDPPFQAINSNPPAITSRHSDSDFPVQDKERIKFQQLLLQLNQKQHFELFNEYQNQAVWRTLEGGEVELDDRGTLPRVFRDMVNWCYLQLRVNDIQKQQQQLQPKFGGNELSTGVNVQRSNSSISNPFTGVYGGRGGEKFRDSNMVCSSSESASSSLDDTF